MKALLTSGLILACVCLAPGHATGQPCQEVYRRGLRLIQEDYRAETSRVRGRCVERVRECRCRVRDDEGYSRQDYARDVREARRGYRNTLRAAFHRRREDLIALRAYCRDLRLAVCLDEEEVAVRFRYEDIGVRVRVEDDDGGVVVRTPWIDLDLDW